MPPHHDRRPEYVLAMLALLLYGAGLWWGLPVATGPDRIHPWASDELAPLGFGELYPTLLHAHTRFDPRYPLFHYVVLGVMAAPYLAWLWLTGGLAGASPVYPYGFHDPIGALQDLTVLGRLPSVVMGAALVAVAHRTAVLLCGARAGLAAGLLVLLVHPLIYYARTSNVDAAALFWIGLGVLVFVRILRDGFTARRAAWLGVWAALATGTKDASYAVFLPLGLYLLGRQAWRPAGEREWRPLAAGLVSAASVYAIAGGLLINPVRYWQHVTFIVHGSPLSAMRQAYGATPATIAGYLTTARSLVAYTIDAVGAIPLAASAAGVLMAMRRAPGSGAIAASAASIVVLVIAPVRFVEYRFVLPIAYVVALFAGCGFAAGFAARSRGTRVAVGVAFTAAIIVLALQAADLTIQTFTDSRYAAARWFDDNVRPGDRVTYTDYSYKLPRFRGDAVLVAMPPGDRARPFIAREAPEFITVIPVLRGEDTHEHLLPDEVFDDLVNGTLGYREVLDTRTPSLLAGIGDISYVNPRVRVFARADVARR
jgi:hypothetical protein